MTDRAGKYEKTRLLGEGGMGQVWLARDTELDRQDADEIARFRREAQFAARLNHPNIGQDLERALELAPPEWPFLLKKLE